MKTYIGIKKIQATPMTRGNYNKYRHWDIPKNENPSDEGYLVLYEDGYESWSPKEVFEKAYREIDEQGLSFGEAIECLKNGLKVARSGWNGKGMFLYLVKGVTIPKTSLRNEAAKAIDILEQNETVIINSHIDMKAADGSIVIGWLASQTDMLANDWIVVN